MRNKRGFVVSAVLYPLLILFLALIMGLLSMSSTRKNILDNMKLDITSSIFDTATCDCDTLKNKLDYIIEIVGNSVVQRGFNLNVTNYNTYADFPTSENEVNDIGIVSSLQVSTYYIGKNLPSIPLDGSVWIEVRESSSTAIELDNVSVPIANIKQYQNKTWVNVESAIYTGTEWKKINVQTDTATSADILKDKTAVINGKQIAGSMVNNGYGGNASSVLTYNNNLYYRIPTGFYSINTSHGLSEVKASFADVATALGITGNKIASGQTIAGVSGSYVCASDTTASQSDILSGKTAYINGSKKSGTMTNLSESSTLTHTSSNGTKVILGDAAFVTTNNDGVNRFEIRYAGTGGYITSNTLFALPYSTVASEIGLTSSKLAQGQSVLGVSGSYVCASDTTASASDIAEGKTAYVNGSKVTGTGGNYKRIAFNGTATVSGSAGSFSYGSWVKIVTAKNSETVFEYTLSETPNKVFSCDVMLTGNASSSATSSSSSITGSSTLKNGCKYNEDTDRYECYVPSVDVPSNGFRISRGYSAASTTATQVYWYLDQLTASTNYVYGYYEETEESTTVCPDTCVGTGPWKITYHNFVADPNGDVKVLFTNSNLNLDATTSETGISTSCEVEGNKVLFKVKTGGRTDLFTKSSTFYLSGTIVYK